MGITATGRIKGSAARTIDADGLVVAPGFIDHHTHMDAQILWDPYGTSEPQHGVTSIVMGNCGLALAPVKTGDEDALIKSFVRVEAIPRLALEKGVPWGWHSYPQYLNRLEGRIGINVDGLIGHIAVRQFVMGEESVERRATPEEIERMRQLVREALEGGALGFSTNRNERHMREDGKPVPSRAADDEELLALCNVASELNAGVIQTNLGRHTIEQIHTYDQLARQTQRPIIWQSVQLRQTAPNLWRQQLEGIATTFRDGYRAYGLTHTVPLLRHFTLKNTQVFDEFPTWKNLMFMPEAERKKALADPHTREKLRADFADPRPTSFHRRWDLVRIEKVARSENKKYVGKNVAEIAALRHQDPLDAFLDLALEEDIETTYQTSNRSEDPESMGEILRSPYVLVGTSDAGAHVQFGADFGYSTTLLGLWVRERGVLSLEQAVYKLTFHVASVYGIDGRGLLRPGYAADLAIFDPNTINACEPEWAEDYPAQLRRLTQRSVGMHYTVVNGRVIYEDGRLSDDLPGQILRSSAYKACG